MSHTMRELIEEQITKESTPCAHLCSEHRLLKKGGEEIRTFYDCANLGVHVSTTGIDGGDSSKHEILLQFTGFSLELFGPGFNHYEPEWLRFKICGDAEARDLQGAFQFLNTFFIKHGFVNDLFQDPTR